MRERRFLLPSEFGGSIVFPSKVLAHIYRYKQKWSWQREAGGLLFSNNPQEAEVIVSLATGPYPEDKRSRHGFVPDNRRSRSVAQLQFFAGNDVIGLWHTHPESHPEPSPTDRDTAHEYLARHADEMTGFLLVTLGNNGNPPNISVHLACRSKGFNWILLDEIIGC